MHVFEPMESTAAYLKALGKAEYHRGRLEALIFRLNINPIKYAETESVSGPYKIISIFESLEYYAGSPGDVSFWMENHINLTIIRTQHESYTVE